VSDPAGEGDFDHLMQSPYEDAPAHGEGESEIPWKPPVIAAILGALTVGVYVIFAIVTGPSVESDESVPATTIAAPLPSDALPSGYVQITDDVGAKVESISPTPTATVVAVTTAVAGSVDPQDVRPLEVAYWELTTPSGVFEMQGQYRWPGLVGNDGGYITVQFAPDLETTGAELVAYTVETTIGETQTLELAPDLPTEVSGYRIDIGDGVVIVIDSLTIDDEGGYVEWRVEGGVTARLDVAVRFVGTSESGINDTVLIPDHAGPLFLDPAYAEASPVPYAFGSQYRLVRSGAPLDTAPPPTAISVEFRVSAVTEIAGPVALPTGG
jgi:hypothetical protein